MTNRERIKTGRLFMDMDEGLPEDRERCKNALFTFNSTPPSDMPTRMEAMKVIFGCEAKAWTEPPFNCCYGTNIHFQGGAYLNCGCTFIDDGDIFIEGGVMFGPNVTIATVGHPFHPKYRGYMYTDPVTIKAGAWIGGGAVICPGVTIGKNSVIGAGSVVTKDIPDNVIAAGNPCKVIREIGEEDEKFYYKDRPFDFADMAEMEKNMPPMPPMDGEPGEMPPPEGM